MKSSHYLFSKGELPDLHALMDLLGLTTSFQGEIILEGKDPILSSPHKLGEAVSTALLSSAVAASCIWKDRTGKNNDLKINICDAIHYLHSVHFVWQSGYNMDLGADVIPFNYHYLCKDGRRVWLQCGPPYAKLQNGYLDFFSSGNNRPAIAKKVVEWNGFELEDVLAELGLPCCVVRTKEEWRMHPQGQLLVPTPVIEIEKIAEGTPCGWKKGTSPLDGIKVLDWTHVLAGPSSSMSLAEFGASVLHIASPKHCDPKTVNLGVNHGKKSAFLELNNPSDLDQMKVLLTQSDVFSQSYRPAVSRKFQLTPEKVSHLNPHGMVCLSINAFGHTGPWRDRAGFDQNAQMVTGFSATEGSLEEPKTSPVFYMNDLLTAYLAATGVMTALLRRAKEGGSYHVKVSLTKSCMWAQDLGYISPEIYTKMPERDLYPTRLTYDHNAFTYPPKMVSENSCYGPLVRLAPAVHFSNLPKITVSPIVPYGSCKPAF